MMKLRITRLALLFVILIAGCGDTARLAPREPVTLKFVYLGDEGYYTYLAEEFQSENPNITIELVDLSYQVFSEPEEYDVMLLPHSLFRQFPIQVQEDEEPLFMRLDALMVEDADFSLDDFYPGAVEAFSIEGQSWAVPYMIDPLVMHYNPNLFDRMRVPYPQPGWSWEDFLQTAQRLSSPMDGVYGYAYHYSGQLAVLEAFTFVYQHGGRVFDSLDTPSRTTYNDPLTVEALQWYGDLIHEHQVAPPPGQRTQPYPDRGIEQGKYAMWMDFYSEAVETEEVTPAFAVLPRDESGTAYATVFGLFVTREASDIQAAWEWVKFLSARMPGFLVPARRSLAESEEFRQRVGEENVTHLTHTVQDILPMTLNWGEEMSRKLGQAMMAFQTALTEIQSGEPAQAALDKAQEKSGF